MCKSFLIILFSLCTIQVLATPRAPPPPPPPPPPHNNCAPTSILYVLGAIVIVQMIVLIVLVVYLIRVRSNAYHNFSNDVATTETNPARNSKREIREMKTLNLDRSNSFEFKNQNDSNYPTLTKNKSFSDNASIAKPEDSLSLTIPCRKMTDSSTNVSPKIIKNVTKDMPIILPEQMSLICKEVLKRGPKCDDTTSLQHIDQLVHEAGQNEEDEAKKYASSPELDIYDVLPGSKDKNDDHVNNDSKTKIRKAKDKFLNGSEGFYDLPKEQGSITYAVPYFEMQEADKILKELEEHNKPKTNYAKLSIGEDTSRYSKSSQAFNYEDPSSPIRSSRLLYVNAHPNDFKIENVDLK